MSELISFLSSPTRNKWLIIGTMEVYLRKGFHKVNGEITDTLDIANVNNHEDYRGQGQFKSLVTELQSILENRADLRGPIKGIYVESVLNPRLADSLEHRLGFQRLDTLPPSFYREIKCQV